MPDDVYSGCRRLTGKVCVIAGAASVIGRAVAQRLISEGALVVGVDRKAHSAGSLQEVADLSIETEVKDVFSRIHHQTGRIDFLYNNAGAVSSEDKSLLTTPSETLDGIFADDFRTAWLSCKYCVPYMLRNQPSGGSIVNCSSFLAGMGSATGQMAYNAAKAAVVQMTRDLGTNLARQGIRVNALSLGPIETPQLTEVFSRIGEQERSRRFTHMPFGRFGTLDELAGTVAFLASETPDSSQPRFSRWTAESKTRSRFQISSPGRFCKIYTMPFIQPKETVWTCS